MHQHTPNPMITIVYYKLAVATDTMSRQQFTTYYPCYVRVRDVLGDMRQNIETPQQAMPESSLNDPINEDLTGPH
jgi:hypothetical protein